MKTKAFTCLALLVGLCFATPAVVADPSGGLLGKSLPANFRAFSDDSVWNKAIEDQPKISPDSSLMIANLKKVGERLRASYNTWTIPLFVIDAKESPQQNIRLDSKSTNRAIDPDQNGYADKMPFPKGVWPDPKKDGHMVLIDPALRTAWDYSRLKRDSIGEWSATRVEVWDLDSTGVITPFEGKAWWTRGARGSGMPLIAGLIRPEEIAAGEINHALVFASPVNRKSSKRRSKRELCAPASRTDGRGIGPTFIPEGMRLQLDPDLDLESLNLSTEVEVIARAMQKYGMFNGDGSSTFKIYFQNLGADRGAWQKYDFRSLRNIPIESFRALDCQVIAKS